MIAIYVQLLWKRESWRQKNLHLCHAHGVVEYAVEFEKY
jgi:hypothetical protein